MHGLQRRPASMGDRCRQFGTEALNSAVRQKRTESGMPGNARGPRLGRVGGRAGGHSWPGTGFGSFAVLSLLLPVAAGLTCLKRRRLNDALEKPWLIPDRAPASLFSERELLLARMAARIPGGLAGDFPSAWKTARRSRDEVRAAVVDRIGAILIEARPPAAVGISSSTERMANSGLLRNLGQNFELHRPSANPGSRRRRSHSWLSSWRLGKPR